MKIRQVFDFETMAVSLRSACDISRACRPICGSPISPSSSALGTSAATESTTMMSTAFERISVFRDFEGLLAVVRLRDEKIVHIHAQLARVDGIERVLRVNERGLAAELLRFGDDVQSEGRLAARFRAVDFDHASAREAADAERCVNRNRAGRDHADRDENVAVSQAHDRAFAVRLFNLRIAISRFLVFSSFILHLERTFV